MAVVFDLVSKDPHAYSLPVSLADVTALQQEPQGNLEDLGYLSMIGHGFETRRDETNHGGDQKPSYGQVTLKTPDN